MRHNPARPLVTLYYQAKAFSVVPVDTDLSVTIDLTMSEQSENSFFFALATRYGENLTFPDIERKPVFVGQTLSTFQVTESFK